MLGLEGELQVDDVGAVEAHHDVAFVGDHTLFARLEQPLLLHQLQRVEHSCALEPREEDPAEASRPDAFDDLEIFEGQVLCLLLLEDGFDFEELSLEDFDGFASLEIVVLEGVASAAGLPVHYTSGCELQVF